MIRAFISLVLLYITAVPSFAQQHEELPNWHNTQLRQKILSFLENATRPNSGEFIPIESRIAVFDVDGTLWVEKPKYPQMDFLQTLKNSSSARPSGAEHSLIEWSAKLTKGMTRADYERRAENFLLNSSSHERYKKTYSNLVYKPTRELISLLKEYDFSIYLCTGSDASFIRSISDSVFGVPVSQVIAQAINYDLNQIQGRLQNTRSDAYRHPINLGPGKVSNIINHVGKRPVLAFGNSLGDKDMLQWVAAGGGLSMILVHDDSSREYDYGAKNSAIKAAFSDSKITFVSMKEHFKSLF